MDKGKKRQRKRESYAINEAANSVCTCMLLWQHIMDQSNVLHWTNLMVIFGLIIIVAEYDALEVYKLSD